MKKIFTLLTLLLATITAMATVYTDHRMVTIGSNTPSEMDNVTLTVNDKGGGKFDVVFNTVINIDDSYEDNYGTITFTDLDGTTADGITTISGKLLTGEVTSSGMGITAVNSADVTVKCTDDKAYATLDGIITMYFRDTRIQVTFGKDEFNQGGGSQGGDTDPKDGTVVGEDNFNQTDASFDWDFPIDFKTQKLVSTIDLSTCNANNTNEDVFSIGTDIQNWSSGVANGGNIHCYYTPSTKSLSLFYISANSQLGTYTYDKEISDVEGELSVDLSYQYGLRINGNVIFDGARLEKLFAFTTLHFGSKEGSTRSNATYKQTRVVPVEFEAEESVDYVSTAKLLYDGAYTRSDAATVSLQRTDLNSYDLVIKNVTIGKEILGDLTFSGVVSSYYEGGGNVVSSTVYLDSFQGNAVLSNAGAFATSLGLADGAEIPVSKFSGWIWGELTSFDCTMTIGENEAVYSYDPEEPTTSIFSEQLTSTFSGATQTYDNKTLNVVDYGDGFADITLKNVQFGSMADTDMGNLLLKEVPYTKVGTDLIIAATGLEAELENTPTQALKNWINVAVNGTVSGSNIYLTIDGEAYTMPINLVYGTPIAEAKVYTDKQSVTNEGETTDSENETISVRDDGDGNYTITLHNIGTGNSLEENLVFQATGTTDEDGMTTYTATQAEAPMTSTVWKNYTAYVTITTAKSKDDKFYGVFFVDYGGYAANYSYCGYDVVFGSDFTTDGINATHVDNVAHAVAIYNASGMRIQSLQKGLNIVRGADGKTVKIVK